MATDAAQGDSESLQAVFVLLTQIPNVPDSRKLSLLAAIYPNLVAGTPAIGDFDVAMPTSEVHETVSKANMALQCLHNIENIPLAVFKNLWPLYWRWATFFYTFHDQLSWLDAKLPDTDIACDLVWFVDPLHRNFPQEMKQIFARPEAHGFHAMAVRAWVTVLLRDNTSALDYGKICLRILALLEECWDPSHPSHFGELVDGAGGTVDDLALLIVGHINRILSISEPMASEELMWFVHGPFSLASEIEIIANPADQIGLIVLAPLSAALLKRGIIPATTTLLCAFGRSVGSPPLPTLDRCIALLGRILASREGYRSLPDALKAGLLRCVMYLGQLNCKGFNDSHLPWFWEQMLPGAMVYYQVLSKMDQAIREVEDIEKTQKFKRSHTFKMWLTFKALARERLEVLAKFNAAEYVSYRACENLECNLIRERAYFRECSGCHSAYYCSAECQRQDWNHGRHRESCRLNYSLSLSTHSSLSPKERNFLRALLNHDYGGMIKLQARMAQFQFFNDHPNTECFTLFNYTHGLEVDVFAVNDTTWPEVTGTARWTNDVERMRKSDRVFGLHVVAITQGDGPKYLLIPLRTDTDCTVEIHS
ncbi:hypothetical protein B0H19DRAFT_1382591, partial [Mycena capillaripes]